MRTAIVVVVALAWLLGLTPAAQAKGPTRAVIEGPGLAEPVRVESYEQSGDLPGLSSLMEQTGGDVMFGTDFNFADGRPAGELGPKYTVTYLVEKETVLRQDLYPFAEAGPHTFTPTGQKSMFISAELPSGWFVASKRLLFTLERLGADPAVAVEPPAAPAQAVAEAGSPVGWWLGGGAAALVAVLLAGVVVTRRRGVGARR